MDVTEDPVPVPTEGILFQSVITLSYTGKLFKLKKLLILCKIYHMLIFIKDIAYKLILQYRFNHIYNGAKHAYIESIIS